MKTQKALRRMLSPSESGGESFRLLFHHHPIPMWVYDLKAHAFLEVNGADKRCRAAAVVDCTIADYDVVLGCLCTAIEKQKGKEILLIMIDPEIDGRCWN